jgi:hypothetical protein
MTARLAPDVEWHQAAGDRVTISVLPTEASGWPVRTAIARIRRS